MSFALARKFRLDVTNDLTLASGFVQVKAINDLNDDITPNLEDASVYDSNGWTASEVTMQDGQLTATFLRQLVAGVYDPGQEMIRARRGQFGDAARIGARWYDKNGGPEAYSGVFIPTWKRSQTGVKNLEAVTATLDCTDVPLNINITNPAGNTAVPVITSVLPGAGASGDMVEIQGAGFQGVVATTGVKFGGTNSPKWIVVSDSVLVAQVPTGSAGSAPVIVTNAVGASAAAAFTHS